VDEPEIFEQRKRVEILKEKLKGNMSIDAKQLFVQAATDLASRDHYSGYLGEESFADFEENIDGDFVSIGIEYSRKIDHLLVTDILPNSSASGVLKFDDRIYFLNKQKVEGLDSIQISTLLRGPIDSELALGLRRGEKEDLIEIVLKRKESKKSPLRFSHIIDREKGIGYINIEIFNGHLAKIFKNEYNKLLAGTPKMKSLVLDLRGNPGGGLYSARDFCDLFLKSGLIVATIGNEDGVRGKIEKLNATDKDELKLVPVLILLDRGSASAAELSAGCLQDYQIAKIFGEKSYGKGESQTSFPMFSKVVGDYGIKLTTSKFYTKSGFEKTPKESISGKGVKADYPYDYGFQDKYMARLKSFHRAWGLWSQAIAEGKSIEEAKKKSLYFTDLEKSDPGLKEALEILIKQGEK
jgi:carboxyl-terminal processing protease